MPGTRHMRLISWNVDLFRSGPKSVEKKVEAVCQHSPDIVAFQEVTDRTLPLFREELEKFGLLYSVDSLALVEIARVAYMAERLNELRARGTNDPFQFAYSVSRLSEQYSPPGDAKDIGCLIASRYPLTPLNPLDFDIPWKQRVVSAVVSAPAGEFELHNAHVPTAIGNRRNEIVKAETLVGIYRRLAVRSERPRILCGDLHIPDAELPDGTIVPFYRAIIPDKAYNTTITESDEYLGRPRKWWYNAEMNVLPGLAEYDLPDVFRRLHGYQAREYSWCPDRGPEDVPKCKRYDHIFASVRLNPTACWYLHDLRGQGLSDHSAVVMDFDP
jgi:exonuclease III